MSIGDELNTQRNLRTWIQFSGPGPANKTYFAGQDTSYLQIEGVKQPQLGGIDPMYIFDPKRIGQYRAVATMIKPPDLPKLSLTMNEKRGGIPRQLTKLSCKLNLYELVGTCGDLSQFNTGWDQYVLIYPRGTITDKDYGNRTSFSDDKDLEAKMEITLERDIYPCGPLSFGATGPGSVSLSTTPVNDVFYGNQFQCGDCGTENDGTKWVYAVATGGASAAPICWYSTDGGQNWSSSSIATAANAEAIIRVVVFNTLIVAISKGAGGTVGTLYWNTINQLTGAPGATWTKVTTGFVASKAPNDMIIKGNRIWLVGDGGYIYYTDDPAAGVTVNNAGVATTNALNSVAVSDEVLLAGGASTTVLKSTNNGTSWSSTTTAPGAATVNVVEIVSKLEFFAGDSTGSVYYTNNGGESWTSKTYGGQGSGAVQDILFVTPEVGWIAKTTVTPTAQIYGTLDGGYTWTNVSPRVSGLPTLNTIKRLAYPYASPEGLAANTLMCAGLDSAGTNGALTLGASTLF